MAQTARRREYEDEHVTMWWSIRRPATWSRSIQPPPSRSNRPWRPPQKAHREWSRGSTVAERAALISARSANCTPQRREELAKIIQARDGQAAGPVGGRGGLQCGNLRVLRRQRGASSSPTSRSNSSMARVQQPDPPELGRCPSRHHAVELPLLPGRPVRRPEPYAGQHDPARSTPPQCPESAAADFADLHRRRLPRGRLRQHLRDLN